MREFALRANGVLSELESIDLTVIAADSEAAAKIFRLFRDNASAGGLFAMSACASFCRLGWGTAIDPVEAFSWADQAAGKGYPPGLFQLGLCYETGTGVNEDFHLAMDLFTKAVNGGYSMAALHLAIHYHSGTVWPCSPDKATRYASRAFELGDPFAGYLLGSWHEEGNKVVQSNSAAMRWYLAAAAKGSLLAANRLTLVYSLGQLGVAPDAQLAHRYSELGQEGSTP